LLAALLKRGRGTKTRCIWQAPYRKRLEEEEGGDTHATYAYVAAEAGAKEAGMEPIGQVRYQSTHPLWKVNLYEIFSLKSPLE